MLAPASHFPETVADAMLARPAPSRRAMLMLAVLMALLIAAAVLALQLALAGPGGPAKPFWLAGLLAAALLLGAVVAHGRLRAQERAARRGEACLRRMLQGLRRQRDEALAASEAKTHFLAQLSHELRVPLHAVSGFAQLLQMEDGATPRCWVSGIVDAASHMQALTDDLFDIARIEAGGLKLDIQPLALHPRVGEALRLLRPLADRAGIALRFDEPDEGLQVLADGLRLRQVLLNLVGNAVKYGRPAGQVRVELGAAAGAVLLRVIDDGIGMDAQQLARLFEPFNRLGRESGPVAGSGVGLALARQLMRLMRGEIRVESEPGRGTTVHLRLPMPDPGA